MQEIILTIVLATLGSSGLFSLIQFLCTRRDGKVDNISRLNKTLEKLEKDSVRTQMLVLMSDYPEERAELMKLAQHYFVTLEGNFYMENLFMNYLKRNKMEIPHWFKYQPTKGDKNE